MSEPILNLPLKPCPSPPCMNRDAAWEWSYNEHHRRGIYIDCPGCGMRGSCINSPTLTPWLDGTLERAVAAWNDLPRTGNEKVEPYGFTYEDLLNRH